MRQKENANFLGFAVTVKDLSKIFKQVKLLANQEPIVIRALKQRYARPSFR